MGRSSGRRPHWDIGSRHHPQQGVPPATKSKTAGMPSSALSIVTRGGLPSSSPAGPAAPPCRPAGRAARVPCGPVGQAGTWQTSAMLRPTWPSPELPVRRGSEHYVPDRRADPRPRRHLISTLRENLINRKVQRWPSSVRKGILARRDTPRQRIAMRHLASLCPQRRSTGSYAARSAEVGMRAGPRDDQPSGGHRTLPPPPRPPADPRRARDKRAVSARPSDWPVRRAHSTGWLSVAARSVCHSESHLHGGARWGPPQQSP